MRAAARSLLALTGAVAVLLSGCAGGGGDDSNPKRAARASGAIAPSVPGAAVERVVLISVAGMQPAHYGGGGGGIVRTRGALMPNVATLAANGAYANAMVAVLPSAPYPVHATFSTGLLPVNHGVLGDELIGPRGLYVIGLSRENRIRGVPIWRAAQAAGRSTTALNWPLTQGANIALLLPDMGVPPREPEGTWFELLKGEASPWVLDRLQLMEPTLPELPWPTTILRDELVEKLACQIAAQPVTPAMWLMAFEQSGTALARDGPGSDGAALGLTRVDASIGRIVECFAQAGIADSTAFVIVGDRAMQPIHSVAYPNVALEKVGLITRAPMRLGQEVAQWQAFVRSYGGAGVVYARDEEAALLAREALREEALRTRAFRIVSATALARMDADPEAWFGLEGEAGFGLGKAASGPMVEATSRGGLGGYLPTSQGNEVGFVAWGAGIRPGVRLPRISQVDVAPTVGALIGVRLSRTDGSPVLGALGGGGSAGPVDLGR